MMEERYGKLSLLNIMTNIWLGEWDKYEEIMEEIPQAVKTELPFHSSYNREVVPLWHDNHFFIPGDHFISPYFSSYTQEIEEEETRKMNLLCLISLYEKTGFLYPLEIDRFPDHIGCLTAFLSSVMKEQVAAIQEDDFVYLQHLEELENKFLKQYIQPLINTLLKQANKKVSHSFFKEFLKFYADIMIAI